MEYGIYDTQIYSVKYYLIYSKQELIHATLAVAHTTSLDLNMLNRHRTLHNERQQCHIVIDTAT